MDMRDHRRNGGKHELQPAREQVVERVRALVRNVQGFDAQVLHQHEARQMRRSAHARGAVVEVGRTRFGIGEEFIEGVGRHRRVDHQHIGHVGNLHDGNEVLERVVTHLLVKRLIDRDGAYRVDDQRIAVGRGAHHRLGADIAAAARAVLDDERLPQLFSELLRDAARQQIGGAARGEGDDDLHGLGGVGRGLCLAGERHEAGQCQAGAQRAARGAQGREANAGGVRGCGFHGFVSLL